MHETGRKNLYRRPGLNIPNFVFNAPPHHLS